MEFEWITTDTIVEKTHQYYCNLIPLWEKLYPSSPFNICLPEHFINYLDKPFTNEKIIIIKDSRIENGYTIIKSIYNKPITLKRVLDRMTKDKNYINNMFHNDDYLDGFEIVNNNYYRTIFGSEELESSLY